jgi:hypothetical protein
MRRRQHRDPERASTMLPQSDVGRMDPPRVAPHRPVKRWEERQGEAIANQTALLNMWQSASESLGGLLALTRANAPGDAIGTGTELINAAGANQRGFPGNFQAVALTNFSGFSMTLAAAPAQSQAPSVGPGIYVVPAGCYRVVPLRGAVVTVYGPPGAAYDLTAYSKPRPMDFASILGPADGVVIPAGTTTSQTLVAKLGFGRLVLVQNVSAVAGGTLQVTLNGLTPSGYVYPILVGTALAVTGATPLRVGPALTPSANAVANDVVPRELQVVATVTGTITYGLDYVGNE